MTLAERIEKFNNLMGDIVPPEVKKDLLDKGFFTAPYHFLCTLFHILFGSSPSKFPPTIFYYIRGV